MAEEQKEIFIVHEVWTNGDRCDEITWEEISEWKTEEEAIARHDKINVLGNRRDYNAYKARAIYRAVKLDYETSDETRARILKEKEEAEKKWERDQERKRKAEEKKAAKQKEKDEKELLEKLKKKYETEDPK